MAQGIASPEFRDYEQRMSTDKDGRRISRLSRVSGDERMGPPKILVAETRKDSKMLLISFVLMIFIGLGNKIFQKLQTIPMHNYPNFLNLLITFIYIPTSFAYIYPMYKYGKIDAEQYHMPKKPFAVMGGLDALAGIMQVFGATYLNGSLIILVLQAAIPISMIISKYLLQARYDRFQYVGAVVVAIGIAVVLGPTMEDSSGGSEAVWSLVLILSTIPMTLSSVYKEIALGERELDPVFLNGWVAVFQFIVSLPLTIPGALVSDPPVDLADLPKNLWDGARCYAGINTIDANKNDDDVESDDCYLYGPLFVNIYMVFNVMYNILIILILKYGSANILWLAMTIMVPLGNVAFSLSFVPEHQALKPTDIIGLIIIVSGLCCYRFGISVAIKYFGYVPPSDDEAEGGNDTAKPLLDDSNVEVALARSGDDELNLSMNGSGNGKRTKSR